MKSDLFWHVHHNILIEWCYDYNGRVAHIKWDKPAEEIELRLRLFQPIKGPLPELLIKAGMRLDKARISLDKVWIKLDKARAKYHEARVKYHEVRAKYDEAWAKNNKARLDYDEAIRKSMPELKALHKIECLNCPWDGKTIFSGKR